uniref:RNA helicase n=2 Tax=Eucampia antarctica TaxID=49252 RepID=A0A7S2WP36_9STRA
MMEEQGRDNTTAVKKTKEKEVKHPNKHNFKNKIPLKSFHRRSSRKKSFWTIHPKDTPHSTPNPSALMKKTRQSLPACKAQAEFLSKMKEADENGRVMLVTGETGCGKTTQIPQFILDAAPLDHKIVVAQPRRIAATGVASRVASERGENKPGTASVGCVVRGETAVCDSTRLLFCTTGVLLRQLQDKNALSAVTHIIVDEVHERHLDTDVLLGILKVYIRKVKHLRVILMSATMDADRFAQYWGDKTPRMHIPGFTFPVKDYTLEDVLSMTGYIPPKKRKKQYRFGGGGGVRFKKSPWGDSEHSDDEEKEEEKKLSNNKDLPKKQEASETPDIPMEELLKRFKDNEIDYDLIGILVSHIIDSKNAGDDGSILVFLPGAGEIARAEDSVRRISKGRNLMVLPLHGGLQPRDQQRVFSKVVGNCTKVILATNVAETSITIPDCTKVIDTCREKQSSYDPSNRMPMLVEKFASKDSLKQRRGRAGRVRSGTCFKLISKATLSKLPAHGEPEIKRCALEQTLLSLLFLGVERGNGNFLSTLLDPPNKDSIDAAVSCLSKLGAVSQNGEELSLMPLGMHLAGIPAPPVVGKLLVMGSMLGCRSAAICIAAGMSAGRSPFIKIGGEKRKENDEDSAKLVKDTEILKEREALFKKVGNSDHAMFCAAFSQWNDIRDAGGAKKKVCESLGLSFVGMRDINQLAKQLDSSLRSVGFVETHDSNKNASSWRIIRSLVVAALAPGNIVRVHRPSAKYAETLEGAIEKDGLAKEHQFFARGDSSELQTKRNEETSIVQVRRYHNVCEERVFLHPASTMFSVGTYGCPWLVYHELVRTSKPFLRDATECSSYSLLLFGGKISVQVANDLIIIDDYVHLSANARIGALIGGLRKKIDDLLTEKVKDPTLDISSRVEMKIIVKLLVSDGLGI